MKKLLVICGLLLFSLSLMAQSWDFSILPSDGDDFDAEDYAHRKARMIADDESEEKDVIFVHNDHIGIQLDDNDGEMNEGTWPDDSALIYRYPSAPSTSWLMARVDGSDYHTHTTGTGALPVTFPFDTVYHAGDSTYIYGGWSVGDVDILQTLMPVYLVYPDTVIGTNYFKYEIINTGTEVHTVGLLLQLDTMIGMNDAAELETARGYSGIEEDFFMTDSLGMPPYWFAYRDPAGPAGAPDQLTAMGILTGYDAVTPDRFIVGQWGSLVSTTWDYTPDHMDYTDSAVRIYWFPIEIEPGDTHVVATYFGLGKPLRMGNITLNIEPVSVEDCFYEPNPFNVQLNFANTTRLPISDLRVDIDLPPGMTLDEGTPSGPLTPSDLPASGIGISAWRVRIGSGFNPANDTIWFTVDSEDMDSAAVAYYTLGLPEMGLPPYADAENMVPEPYSVSTCLEQNLKIDLYAENGLWDDGLRFYVDGDTIGLDDSRLTYSNDTLLFTPSTSFESGSYIEYGLLGAEDSMGCMLVAPVHSSFIYDIEPPVASDEFPENDDILGYTDLEEITINLTDAVRDVDTATISLEVNDVVYDWGHEALSYDGETVHFNLEAAGIIPEDGDTFCATLFPASDEVPTYCDPNEMPEAYSWCFRINIIDLWLPDTFGNPGDEMYLYVDIEDLTNMGVTNFDIQVAYFESVLEILDVHNSGITSGWSPLTWTADDGIVSVQGAGDELAGGGHLFKIIARIKDGTDGSFSRLDFASVDFNDGLYATAPVDGFLTVLWNDFNFVGNLIFENEANEVRNILAFGASSSATNLYDPGLDLITLPAVPGEIDAEFTIEDPDYPTYLSLKRDVKFFGDYPIEWTGNASYESDVDVSWEPELLPPGFWTITYDGETGPITINMNTNSSFTFHRETDFVIRYTHPEIIRTNINVCPGWNLLSLPYIPSSELLINEIFPTALTPAFIFNAETRRYETTESPQAGEGFWVFFEEEAEFEIAGARVEEVSMPIYPGWNLIGMPALSTTDVRIITTPEDLSIFNIYWYDACGASAYVDPEDAYRSGLGYFMLFSDPGTINIIPGE